VHPNDRRRVVRALELADAGASLRPGRDRLWTAETRRPTLVIGLEVSREELLRRIEQRTREMLRRGVVQEARAAIAGGPSSTAAKVRAACRSVSSKPAPAVGAPAPVTTLALLTFITSWNEYFWPLLVGTEEKVRVLTVALGVFRTQTPQGSPDWAGLMAASLVAAVPIVVLFVIFGKRVVDSIGFSGIK